MVVEFHAAESGGLLSSSAKLAVTQSHSATAVLVLFVIMHQLVCFRKYNYGFCFVFYNYSTALGLIFTYGYLGN